MNTRDKVSLLVVSHFIFNKIIFELHNINCMLFLIIKGEKMKNRDKNNNNNNSNKTELKDIIQCQRVNTSKYQVIKISASVDGS